MDEMPVSKGEKVGDKIQFLINVIGLVIIDIGAFAYMEIYDEGKIFALIILMFGNGIGGCLYKYSKNNRRK